MKIYLALLTTILFSFIFMACTEEETGPPNKNNSVSISFPLNNSVIGDSVMLKVTLQEPNAVDKVEYQLDGVQLGTALASTNFEYKWVPSSPQIGRVYKLTAKATDKSGSVVVSDTVSVSYKWYELITDNDNLWAPDINRLLIRSSTTHLETRVECYGNWVNPYLVAEGISFAVFLDTDRNKNTGLSSSVPFGYAPNDIGADYMMICGFEDNALYKWNQADSSWKRHENLVSLELQANSSFSEMKIPRASIGNPASADIAALLLTTAPGQDANKDWAPDTTHATYTINGLYIGKESLNKVSHIAAAKKLYLLKK
ncbi:MAG: Ig-like domain-containing protein [Ignavibacteriaceae bacterium]|nr:Ig-like domain-containing protein [Ignavibacteriaceae bacterium]